MRISSSFDSVLSLLISQICNLRNINAYLAYGKLICTLMGNFLKYGEYFLTEKGTLGLMSYDLIMLPVIVYCKILNLTNKVGLRRS